MSTHADKMQENTRQYDAKDLSQKQSGSESTFQVPNNLNKDLVQRKMQEIVNNSSQLKKLKIFQEMANNSPQANRAAQMQAIVGNHFLKLIQRQEISENEKLIKGKFQTAQLQSIIEEEEPIQAKPNQTGLPDKLKAGIENLSGFSMDDVKVHYHSTKPASLQAHAYTQGNRIHLGPGQEKHLPHEAWHVVQQKQGKVIPNLQLKEGISVNYEKGLEREADKMGDEALKRNSTQLKLNKIDSNKSRNRLKRNMIQNAPIQMRVGFELEDNNWQAYIKEKGKGLKSGELRAAVRKEILYPGKGFNLEADDSKGASQPTIEFVTDPFEVSPEGLADVNFVFAQIDEIMNRIGEYAGRKGDLTNPKKGNFVKNDKHKLGEQLWLSKGEPQASFKMQATQGLSLEDLPTFMKYYGSNAPKETEEEKEHRTPARKFMYEGKLEAASDSKQISNLLAAAPSLAQLALGFMISKDDRFAAADPDPLLGFVSLVLLYVKGLSVPDEIGHKRQAKYFTPLLARTNFAELFALLPRKHQKLLRANDSKLLIDAVVEAANAEQLIKIKKTIDRGGGKIDHIEEYCDVKFTPDSPLVRAQHLGLASLTIDTWLNTLAQEGGVDLLNAEQIGAVVKESRALRTAKSALESFSVLGENPYSSKTEPADIKGHSPLGIFENRFISGSFNVTKAHQAAYNYLKFFINMKKTKGVPGMYPTDEPKLPGIIY